MGLAVTLYFDAATEEGVLEVRRALYAAGVAPSEGIEELRPHLTLGIVEEDDEARVTAAVRAVAEDRGAFELRLSAVGAFPTAQNVLFLVPAPSEALLGLHGALQARLAADGLTTAPYYLPGVWTPHCTLEKDFTRVQLYEAFRVVRRSFRPLAGRCVELGVVALEPLRVVLRCALRPDPD